MIGQVADLTSWFCTKYLTTQYLHLRWSNKCFGILSQFMDKEGHQRHRAVLNTYPINENKSAIIEFNYVQRI